MRYLLHEEKREELQARQQYLYDVFRMYFLPGQLQGEFIPLYPIGKNCLDILFIVGHTNQVDNYLRKMLNSIPEKTIVITSCMVKSFKKYVKRKTFYVPNLNQPLCHLRDGKPYGFGFNISDAELDLYNSTGTIIEKIQSAYTQLK